MCTKVSDVVVSMNFISGKYKLYSMDTVIILLRY